MEYGAKCAFYASSSSLASVGLHQTTDLFFLLSSTSGVVIFISTRKCEDFRGFVKVARQQRIIVSFVKDKSKAQQSNISRGLC